MRFFIVILFAVSACTSFPALDGSISEAARQAPYPTLTEIPTVPASAVTDDSDLQARVAALQARAMRLRQIDIAALQ